jgi:uncharacterized membrane protein
MVGTLHTLRTRMKNNRVTACLIIGILLLLLFPVHQASCQNYYEYKVQINADGSALWNATQFSSINTPADTWEGFQEKIFNLVDSAVNITHREMSIDENSIQIKTTMSADSKITEYSFLWQNFSLILGKELLVGDVFQAPNFFAQLYGDAALQLSYPSNFTVKSVFPTPYDRQDSAGTLRWSRTEDLVNSQTSIVLTSNPQTASGSGNGWQQYALVTFISLVGVSLAFLGIYVFRRRKNQGKSMIAKTPVIVTEEDKVIKRLREYGGTMRQTEITEQCRFSKAKTSQLLAALEQSGNITRYKKGRDKIVTLQERVKSE